MRMRLHVFLALVFTLALTTPSLSQQPTDPVSGCATDCPDESCTPEPFYDDNPIDLADWEGCDVCCVDAQVAQVPPGDNCCGSGSGANVGGFCANDAACDDDPPCNPGEGDCAGKCGSYLVAGRQALIDKGVCTAANITLVNDVSDCTTAICDAFTGTKLNVCVLGHGSPGSIAMGAGKGPANDMCGAGSGANAGGVCANDNACDDDPPCNAGEADCEGKCRRNVLDAVSKPFFVGAVAGKIEEIHMFGCSIGQDWNFLQWLAQGLDAHVKAPDKVICAGGNLVNNLNCFWFEMGGDFHAAWPLPHFTMTINFQQDVFGDSGPVDTVGLGIGEGPFVYETLPAGIDLDGMITEDLPDGLSTDPNTGAVSGTPTTAGTSHVAWVLRDPETGEPWDILWCEITIEGFIIPTVSEWGLIVMTLLALTAGTIVFTRRRRPAVA